MNAFECLEAYQKAAGFDGWVESLPKQPIYTPKLELGENVDTTIMRPAWRDGDGWFVLPDGWTWGLHSWQKGDAVVEYYPDDGWVAKIRVDESHWFNILDCYPTAPEAFRAAERYLKGGEG